jgi:carbonic anhydrase
MPPSRRITLPLLALLVVSGRAAANEEPTSGPSAGEILGELREGNLRFAADSAVHPRDRSDTRKLIEAGQHPKAIVLSCSDSRVAPELLFDEGLGDLFVVRTAGNVVDPIVLGSVEYAAEHLGAGVLVVLGHSRCGAVTAAVKGGHAHGHLPAILREIRPSVAALKGRVKPERLVEAAIRENARRMARALVERSELLAKLVRQGKLTVVAGVYDLATGQVELLPARAVRAAASQWSVEAAATASASAPEAH